MAAPADLLSGLKVLDLTWYAAGPYATRLMAGLGAEVVKIERPGSGDPARRLGPFPDDLPHQEKSALHLYLNSGKKGVTLNLKSASGREIVRLLAANSDIVIESFSPRVMPDLGFDYESLSAAKSDLVMTSISNFGQTGPYRDYRAAELNLYAFGGVMYITGEPDREPLQMAARLAEYGAGQNAFVATLSALWHKENTGEGQHVDVAISEHIATILENALSMYSYTGSNFQRSGNRGYGRAAWGPYPCQDGWVGVIAGPDHKWSAMAELMEDPRLADPRFDTRSGRAEHADELDVLMLPWLSRHTKRDIFEKAQHLGLAFSFVATPEDILEMDHLRERGFFTTVEHPEAGPLEYPTGPYKIDGKSWDISPAPTLGQHNREIYCNRLGYSRADLVLLRETGVI